jgi:hypothetical protein
MWLDDCRIPISENDDPRISKKYKWGQKPNPFGEAVAKVIGDGWNQQGRFTPNLLVCHDMLNDGDKRSNSRYYDLDLWFNKMIDEL